MLEGKTLTRRALLALLLGLLQTGSARASLIVNESFETGPDPGNSMQMSMGSTAITGWVVVDAAVDYVGSGWNAADGARSLALNGTSPGGVSQTFATVIGGEYIVTFSMAGDAFSSPIFKHMRVSAAGQSQDYEHDAGHAWPWDLGWLERTFIFTANATSTTLTFRSLDSGSTGPTLDKVSVTGPDATGVPEISIPGFRLSAPHPNPARAGVWIDFDLPEGLEVRLTVADLLGREVSVITQDHLPAGHYSRFWDGRTNAGEAAPAGIYFLLFTSPSGTSVRKAALLP